MWRVIILLGASLLGAVAPAAGQTAEPRVPQVGVLPAAARVPVTADHLFRPGNVAISFAAGGAAFSDFQRGWAQSAPGQPQFQRRLSAGTTAAVGADVLWWLTGGVGLRLQGSFMPSHFSIKHDEAGEVWLRQQAGTPQTTDYAQLRVWTADLTAVIRAPLPTGRVAPYALIGGGVISYRPASSRTIPPEAADAFAQGPRTAAAAVVGVGAAVPLQRQDLLLSFALTDHIARTPVAPRAGPELLHDPRTGLSLDPEAAEQEVRLVSNLRLMVGLTVPLRRR